MYGFPGKDFLTLAPSPFLLKRKKFRHHDYLIQLGWENKEVFLFVFVLLNMNKSSWLNYMKKLFCLTDKWVAIIETVQISCSSFY